MYPILISIGVALILGVTQVVNRFILPRVSYTFVLIVSAIVYSLLVCIYVVISKGDVLKELKTHSSLIPVVALITFFGFFVANYMYMYVIKNAKNINVVTIIMGLYPIFTLLLATFVLKESLNGLTLLGFLLILIGMAIMLKK